jgi:hypothetical protein
MVPLNYGASKATADRTGPARRRAMDLYEAIFAQHHRERAVRELRDVVAG